MDLHAGLVLADFNKHFLGSTFQSEQDTHISADAVTSAALVAARALHEIASGGRGASELKASPTMQLILCECMHRTAPWEMTQQRGCWAELQLAPVHPSSARLQSQAVAI